ncbi:uncharacterized protein G2W53_006542 [Senna tora]|uniref:Uncharacterized protein n=1 Tax=Senna tora TaxID=362788 RepID=A0A834X5A0_9FABA|nr:uncharacterized protein G2W53_006542 [Senna tora]
MAGNNDKVHFTGFAQVVPYNGGKSNQSVGSHTTTSRAAYDHGNYKYSGRHTESYKAGDYVHKSGNVGYKEEARSTSTFKYTDKVQGMTTEYQTQVNVKKMVYPSTTKASSSKRINYY